MEAPKTTCYHSELTKRGQVTVIVETDVLPSKYAGKPPYVMFKLDGFSRRYDTENDACAAVFVGMKGCQVSLTATGSRETAAVVIHGPGQAAPQHAPPPQAYRGAPTQPQPQSPHQQSPAPHYNPAPAAPPAPHVPVGKENPVVHCKRELNKVANGMLFCLAAGEYVRQEWDKGHPDRPMTDAHFQATVSTIFIAADRRMLFTDIPTGSIENIS